MDLLPFFTLVFSAAVIVAIVLILWHSIKKRGEKGRVGNE